MIIFSVGNYSSDYYISQWLVALVDSSILQIVFYCTSRYLSFLFFPVCLTDLRVLLNIFNTYLVFLGHTVNYWFSFCPIDLCSVCFTLLRHINGKNSVHNLLYRPWTQSVRGIYCSTFSCPRLRLLVHLVLLLPLNKFKSIHKELQFHHTWYVHE